MASYLITGTGRGIGLELVRTLATKPASEVSKIFAAHRTKTDALTELVSSSGGRVEAVPMDVTDEESIKQAASQVEKSLAGKGLDVLVNNAGVLPITEGGIQKMTDLESVFRTDVTSVHWITTALLPLLEKGNLKKIVNVSSTVGSMGMVDYTRHLSCPAYKVSKYALNMLTVQWAQALEDKGFIVYVISPGWVKTDLGGPGADLTLAQAIPAIEEVVLRQNKEDNGKFLDVVVPGFEPMYTNRFPPW